MNTPDLELVLVANNQAADLEQIAQRVHQYVTYAFAGTWHMTIVDHASSDGTWAEAERVAGGLRATTALHLLQQLSRRALHNEFSSCEALTAAFLVATPDMDLDDILAPLLRTPTIVTRNGFSRRQLLSGAGGVGAMAFLAACGSKSSTTSPTTTASPVTTGAASAPTSAASASGSATVGSTATAATTTPSTAATATPGAAVLAAEITEGPYWLDLNLVRSDIREDRPGAPLTMKLAVVDVATGKPIEGANVDIWHCDADGIYSGFTGASAAANPGGGQAGTQPTGGGNPPSGTPADGQAGGPPPGAPAGGQAGGPPPGGRGGPGGGAQKADDKTFLRGIQPTDKTGVAMFTSVYPGWYNGRTVHIHVKVNVGGKTIHTGQLFFDDTYTDAVFQDNAPYNARSARQMRNASDGIFNGGGAGSIFVITKDDKGYAGSMTMGVKTV
jgi:protocatechuate 3,4-dioxygenase beta subunit